MLLHKLNISFAHSCLAKILFVGAFGVICFSILSNAYSAVNCTGNNCGTNLSVRLYNSFSGSLTFDTGNSNWVLRSGSIWTNQNNAIINIQASTGSYYSISGNTQTITGNGTGSYVNSFVVNFVGEGIQGYEAELDKNGEFLFPDDLIVYTDYTAPTQAINTSYNDGAIITDPTITFQWTASIDTGVGIAGYLLYISLDPSFIGISPVLVNNTSISFNSTNLPLGTLFYKIIALDYLGQASSTQVHYISNQMTSLLPIIGGQGGNGGPSSSNNTQIDIQNKTGDYQNNNEQSIIDIIDTRLENLLQSNLDQGDARVTRIIEYDPEKNHSVAPVVLLEELIPNIGQIIGQLEVIDTQVSQTQDTEDESQSDQNIENQLEDRINLDDKNNELNEISDNQNNNSNSQADRSSNLKPYLLEKYRENQSVNWIPPDLLEEFNLDRSEIRPLNKSDIRRFLENNKKSLTEYLTIENIMLIMIVSILSYYLFILQGGGKNFSP